MGVVVISWTNSIVIEWPMINDLFTKSCKYFFFRALFAFSFEFHREKREHAAIAAQGSVKLTEAFCILEF